MIAEKDELASAFEICQKIVSEVSTKLSVIELRSRSFQSMEGYARELSPDFCKMPTISAITSYVSLAVVEDYDDYANNR